MPKLAQVSGVCDLYFGHLNKYGESVSYYLVQGFTWGHGEVESRYDSDIVGVFASILNKRCTEHSAINPDEASALMESILEQLKVRNVRKKIMNVAMEKSESWSERITLVLNIVRNIARRQPSHINSASLAEAIYVPAEFGQTY